MFGYITPLKSELRVRELTQYQAWYCGLCNTIRQSYGQIPRLALDYDCTFLALLLAGAEGSCAPCELRKCGYKPLQKAKPMAPACDAISYAADINVLLYEAKLADDWHDERNVPALLGKQALGRAAAKAAARRPEATSAIREGIRALSLLEAQGETSIDAAADAFAGLLRRVAAGYPPLEGTQREALSWLGYHMGRWIYLMDAWEDRAKDMKHGAYNPFLAAGADLERASFLLYASLHEMEKAYDLLTIHCNRGLLDNILYQGCRQRCKLMLEGADG